MMRRRSRDTADHWDTSRLWIRIRAARSGKQCWKLKPNDAGQRIIHLPRIDVTMSVAR